MRKPRVTVHHFPVYISNWRDSRTRMRLNAAERGIFWELIFYCYKEGSVPDDPILLARICDVPVDDFNSAWPNVSKSFQLKGGEWHNRKVDEELPAIERRYEQKREAGLASAQRKLNGRSTDVQHPLNIRLSESPTIEEAVAVTREEAVVKTKPAKTPDVGRMSREFLATYPAKMARSPGLVTHWYVANVGVCVDPEKLHTEILAGLIRAIASEEWGKADGKYICAAMKFLEGERWREEWPPAEKPYVTPDYRPEDWEQ